MTSATSPGQQRPEPEPGRLRYIPALDGMRGISLPGTILTHYAIFLGGRASAPHWLRGVGPLTLNIQMFFVLSGALITSMLVAEHQRVGDVSLKRFYLRRSRRLGPALVFLLPCMAVAHLAWTGNPSLPPLGLNPLVALVTVSIFVGNWALFAVSNGIGWMGPAWTLGIEEQFYLTWPLLLKTAMRRNASRVAVFTGLVIALVLSIGIASVLIGLVLAAMAIMLLIEAKGLLIGEAADPTLVKALHECTQAHAGVVAVKEVLTVHQAPDMVVAIISADFEDSISARDVEQTVADIEAAIAARFPLVTRVYIRPLGSPESKP